MNTTPWPGLASKLYFYVDRVGDASTMEICVVFDALVASELILCRVRGSRIIANLKSAYCHSNPSDSTHCAEGDAQAARIPHTECTPNYHPTRISSVSVAGLKLKVYLYLQEALVSRN